MRWAMVTAARRRGWVTPTRPAMPRPASRHIFGIWVLLPQPVSPETMTTRRRGERKAATISPARVVIGSSGGYETRGTLRARAASQASNRARASALLSIPLILPDSADRDKPLIIHPLRCGARTVGTGRRHLDRPRG